MKIIIILAQRKAFNFHVNDVDRVDAPKKRFPVGAD